MPKFTVSVSKRVYANVDVVAATQEEAENIVSAMRQNDSVKFSSFDFGECAEDYSVDWIEQSEDA